MKELNILCAEEQEIIRNAIVQIVKNQKQFQSNVDEVFEEEEIYSLIQKNTYDLIIVGDSFQSVNPLKIIRDLKSKFNQVNIIFFGNKSDVRYAQRVINAGALGYILKSSYPGEVIKAIKTVAKSKKYYSNEISQALLEQSVMPQANVPLIRRKLRPGIKVTDREIEVLKLLAKGNTDKEIAEKLFLSVRTIGNYRQKMIDKFEVKNSVSLISEVYRCGLIKLYDKTDSIENKY